MKVADMKCPPHQYRASGKPFRPVIRKKKVKQREYWNSRRKITKTVLVLGTAVQVWFCSKCGETTKSQAGSTQP